MRPPRRRSGRGLAVNPFPTTSLLAAVVAIATTASAGVAQPAAQSPAQGQAQVIAQGVARLPAVPVAWRVARATAPPAIPNAAPAHDLGFVLADRGIVTVGARGGAEGEQVWLDPGEAVFVPGGSDQDCTSAASSAAEYYAIELVAAADAAAAPSVLGGATLLFFGEPFAVAGGWHELSLVRDVLAPGEASRLPAGAGRTLVLATAGVIGAHTAGGGTGSLRAGEATSVDGAVDLSAAGDEAAAFVAAVIGPAVGANGPAALPTLEPPTAATGTIAVTPYACPAGMRPETFDPIACEPNPDVIDLQTFVIGSGANLRTLADAAFAAGQGEYVWSGLPFGEYLVQATGFAPGYDRFLVPGLAGINSPPELGYTAGPNEGYLVPLAAATPTYRLGVFAFRAPAPVSAADVADLGFWLWSCPSGVAAAPDLRDAGCELVEPLGSGFDLTLNGPALAAPLTLAETVASDAGAQVWEDVPFGSYTLTATLPSGNEGYAVRSYRDDFPIRLLSGGTGYTLTIGAALFDPGDEYRRVNLDVYLLR